MASESLASGVASAATLGVGVGGLHVLLRLAWADYYGRQHLGSIRGVTLPVQITGQALGPIISGFMYDVTDSYRIAFIIFAISASLVALLVLNATPPGQQANSRQESQGI
jgi:MFS family permease